MGEEAQADIERRIAAKLKSHRKRKRFQRDRDTLREARRLWMEHRALILASKPLAMASEARVALSRIDKLLSEDGQ